MITTSNKLDLWTTLGGLVQRLGIFDRFESPRFKVDNLAIDIQRSTVEPGKLLAIKNLLRRADPEELRIQSMCAQPGA
jgi:hypothetical protein